MQRNHLSFFRKTSLVLALTAALSLPVNTYAAPGDPVGGEFRVNTTTLGNQLSPAVASDAKGNYVVVWQSSDGSGDGIYA